MNINDEMKSGNLYLCTDPLLAARQAEARQRMYELNDERDPDSRMAAARGFFAEFGEGSFFEKPVYANWGCNTHIGKNVYINFGLTLVDDTDIFIGDFTMIGPNVTICTAGHPVEPSLREIQVQYNKPVKIGRNVWIGASVTVLPGVEIGDNSVIGAGSVVTRSVGANKVAYGVPCREIRDIDERDRHCYFGNIGYDYGEWENRIKDGVEKNDTQ